MMCRAWTILFIRTDSRTRTPNIRHCARCWFFSLQSGHKRNETLFRRGANCYLIPLKCARSRWQAVAVRIRQKRLEAGTHCDGNRRTIHIAVSIPLQTLFAQHFLLRAKKNVNVKKQINRTRESSRYEVKADFVISYRSTLVLYGSKEKQTEIRIGIAENYKNVNKDRLIGFTKRDNWTKMSVVWFDFIVKLWCICTYVEHHIRKKKL